MRRRRIASFAALREHWREDYAANGRRFFRPGFQAVAIYRLGVWADGLENRFARYPLRKLHNLLFHAAKGLYGIEIPASAEIGRRLHIAHQSGIVISDRCAIGDDCLIHQNVTVGHNSIAACHRLAACGEVDGLRLFPSRRAELLDSSTLLTSFKAHRCGSFYRLREHSRTPESGLSRGMAL